MDKLSRMVFFKGQILDHEELVGSKILGIVYKGPYIGKVTIPYFGVHTLRGVLNSLYVINAPESERPIPLLPLP